MIKLKRWHRRVLRTVASVALLLIITILLIRGTNLLVYQFAKQEPAHLYMAQKIHPVSVAAPDSLCIVDWNLKFGGGRLDFFFDCYGDRSVMTKDEVLTHLRGIARMIDSLQPDILLVQEIDVAGKRVAGIDQVQWLLDNTAGLNYAAYASQWRVRYLPQNGLGKINSGIAIFSKYPIRHAVRHALPQMTEQDPLVRFFYLRRCILQAEVVLPRSAQPLTVLNTHLEAYGHDGTKQRQLELLIARAQGIHAAGKPLLVGGDLNCLPPGAVKTSGFDDNACPPDGFVADDYSRETELLKPLYTQYSSAIPLADYLADERSYFTHSVNGKGWWNRTLDYLFSNQSWAEGSGTVHQQGTYHLSDHAPLSGVLLWQPSK